MSFVETGVLVNGEGVIAWHMPSDRSAGHLGDDRSLWDLIWEYREDSTLGFAHTHPGSGIPGPSWTDITTFAAVEAGLGRRINWWITSSDHVIHLCWIGPEKHLYTSTVVEGVPDWADQLRDLSAKEESKWKTL